MPETPVFLLHGFATSAASTWGENGWIDLLQDMGREVVAPDLLGHGRAPKPHDPSAYADLEAQVISMLPEDPCDAIGFSLGARVLLGVAATHPSRFRRLVVAGVGANLFRDDPTTAIEAALESVAGPAGGDGSEPDNPAVQYFAGLARQPGADPLALLACIRSPRPPLGDGRLKAIDIPVLVVIGDHDFAGPADQLGDELPNATIKTLRGVDHFATPKNFGFIDAALEFLA